MSEQEASPPAYAPNERERNHGVREPQLPSVTAENGLLPKVRDEEIHPAHSPNIASLHAPPDPQMRQLPPIESLLSPTASTIPMTGARTSLIGALRAPHQNTTSSHQDSDTSSAMDVDGAYSVTASTTDDNGRAGSVVSIEDPDVRMAAEALGDLRSDYASPPRHSYGPSSTSALASLSPENASLTLPYHHPEPLLSLLMTTHPLLTNAINQSISAYSTSKSHSPRFIQYGAELVERHIGSPVVATVNSMSRRTGMDDHVRRYLGRRHRHPGSTGNPTSARESPEAEQSSKRRKVDDAEHLDVDLERGPDEQEPLLTRLPRLGSASETSLPESLPAYDDQRAPSYQAEEQNILSPPPPPPPTASGQRPDSPAWHSRLMISTSGLGAAMSEESLKRLKFCLSWLRGANGHLGRMILALKDALDEWDNAGQASTSPESEKAAAKGERATPAPLSPSRESELLRRMESLKHDVIRTLKSAVDVVSKYTGAALPENARVFVKGQLMSLPRRFQLASGWRTGSEQEASTQSRPGTEVANSAKRTLVLAREGLEMFSQVSRVVNDTMISAEEWCEKLGRRPATTQAGSQTEQLSPQRATSGAPQTPISEKDTPQESQQGAETQKTEEKAAFTGQNDVDRMEG